MAVKLRTKLALVVLIIGVIAYPWAGPSLSTKLSGFDPNFLYVEPQVKGQPTGLIDVKPEKLNITSVGQSQPTVLLAWIGGSIQHKLRHFSNTRLRASCNTVRDRRPLRGHEQSCVIMVLLGRKVDTGRR